MTAALLILTAPAIPAGIFREAYLRHLFVSREILSMRLNTLHNLHFYQTFFKNMRVHRGRRIQEIQDILGNYFPVNMTGSAVSAENSEHVSGLLGDGFPVRWHTLKEKVILLYILSHVLVVQTKTLTPPYD